MKEDILKVCAWLDKYPKEDDGIAIGTDATRAPDEPTFLMRSNMLGIIETIGISKNLYDYMAVHKPESWRVHSLKPYFTNLHRKYALDEIIEEL